MPLVQFNKFLNVFFSFVLTCVLGAQSNKLFEFFGYPQHTFEIRKICLDFALLSIGLMFCINVVMNTCIIIIWGYSQTFMYKM